MKTYQYLKTGILEAYLLGLTTEKERAEVQQLLTTDATILAELNELEADMENYFLRHSVPPPPSIREAIELRISNTDIEKWQEPTYNQSNSKPNGSAQTEPDYVKIEVDDTHIRVHKHWRPAFIAVFILSKIFLVLGLYYYFKSDSQSQEIMRLKTELQKTTPVINSQTP